MSTSTSESTQHSATAFMTACPECEWSFSVEMPQVGEVVVCPDCNLNLIVKGLDEAARRAALELTDADADDWGE